MIYLDYQATTPADPAIVEAMAPFWSGRFGNPHSQHRFGWEAEASIDVARAQIASLVAAQPEWVMFTSGATEANNLALKGAMMSAPPERRRLITLATEHSCILESARWLERQGFELTILGVRPDGLIRLDELEAALGEDVALVSVMAVNNEIGVIQPLAAIGERVRGVGALFHTDAAQAFGKIPLDVAEMNIDLMSITAHKVYGPKGIGTLLVRPGIRLTPQLHGGGQEGEGLRSGTLPPALIAGFGAAAKIAAIRREEDTELVETFWRRMLKRLPAEHIIHGSTEHRWRGNLNIAFAGIDGVRLIADLRSLAISSGAACASAKGKHSHVLEALGVPEAQAKASLRIGWGRFTKEEEIDEATAMISEAVAAQRRAAA